MIKAQEDKELLLEKSNQLLTVVHNIMPISNTKRRPLTRKYVHENEVWSNVFIVKIDIVFRYAHFRNSEARDHPC